MVADHSLSLLRCRLQKEAYDFHMTPLHKSPEWIITIRYNNRQYLLQGCQPTSTATCNGVAPDAIDVTWEAPYPSNSSTFILSIGLLEILRLSSKLNESQRNKWVKVYHTLVAFGRGHVERCCAMDISCVVGLVRCIMSKLIERSKPVQLQHVGLICSLLAYIWVDLYILQ